MKPEPGPGPTLRRSLSLPPGQLARLTSLITLLIFAAINGALWYIRHRDGPSTDTVAWPLWVPIGGLALNLLLVGAQGVSMLR